MQKAERKEKIYQVNVEFQRIARKGKNVFLSEQCKEIEENNRLRKTELSSRKLETPRDYFVQMWAQ